MPRLTAEQRAVIKHYSEPPNRLGYRSIYAKISSQYPNITLKSVQRALKRLNTSGSIDYEKREGRKPTKRTPENIERVLQEVREQKLSARMYSKLAKERGEPISHSTVRQILKEYDKRRTTKPRKTLQTKNVTKRSIQSNVASHAEVRAYPLAVSEESSSIYTATDNTTKALLNEAARLIDDIDASTVADADSRQLLNTVVDGLRELTRRSTHMRQAQTTATDTFQPITLAIPAQSESAAYITPTPYREYDSPVVLHFE